MFAFKVIFYNSVFKTDTGHRRPETGRKSAFRVPARVLCLDTCVLCLSFTALVADQSTDSLKPLLPVLQSSTPVQ